MMTGSPMAITTSRLSSYFKIYENQYSEAMIHVASGKRVSSPFDSATDYFHARRFNREYSDYERVRSDTMEVSSLLDVVSSIGEQVYDGFSRMQHLVDTYYDSNTTAEEKEVMAADFKSIINEISSAINNGYYEGKKLVSDTSVTGPLKTINLDPRDFSQTFSVEFDAGQVADTSGLTLGVGTEADEAANVQAQLDKAAAYLGKTAGYTRGINAQYNIAVTKINTSHDAESIAVDSDSGMDVVQAVDRSIRYQATSAMLAQANLLNASIVSVLGI